MSVVAATTTTTTTTTASSPASIAQSEKEKIVCGLRKCLSEHNRNRVEVQNRLHNFCETCRKQANESEMKETESLENEFAKEVSPLQSALESCPGDSEVIRKLEECEENRRASQEKTDEKI